VPGKPLLCIERQIRVNERLVAFNHVYLDPDVYPFIAAMPLRALHGANIAHLVQEEGRLPVSKIAHMGQCGPLPEAACGALGLARGTFGMTIEIAASAGQSRPVSYQRIFMASSQPRIYISDSSGDWHAGAIADAAAGNGAVPAGRKSSVAA
jgi:DNA-binding GntR family transcriptional regulator